MARSLSERISAKKINNSRSREKMIIQEISCKEKKKNIIINIIKLNERTDDKIIDKNSLN